MNDNSEMVTSIFGKMTRRELFQSMAISGLAVGLGGAELSGALASPPSLDGVAPPPKDLSGTPFRDIKQYQSYVEKKIDIANLQKSGTPKPRTRDASWYYKPANAYGVNLLQFTNTANNSCAQAACATVLNYYKIAPAGFAGDAITNKIYAEHPPDAGAAGTTWTQMIAIKQAYGLKTWSGRSDEFGEAKMVEILKTYVSQGRPCTVLLDLRGPARLTSSSMCGHYVVVFAYSDTHVFMTNWDYRPTGWSNDWANFKYGWSLPSCQTHHLMAIGWV